MSEIDASEGDHRQVAGRRGRRPRVRTSRPRPSRSGTACSARTAPATPPATAAWSARSSSAGASPRPYGGYFDEVADGLEALVAGVRHGGREGRRRPRRAHLPRPARAPASQFARALRDDPALRFELCPASAACTTRTQTGRELHAVYPCCRSPTTGAIRVEVTVPGRRPARPVGHRASTRRNDWHERETCDFFGIVFDGHPALTRILMPDDWPGHPQRKDYPLGGIPVEYKGAQIPPPDERRSYSDDRHLRRLRPTTDVDRRARDHRGHASTPSPAGTGTSLTQRPRRDRRRARSSSTWVRSTRRRTACSG